MLGNKTGPRRGVAAQSAAGLGLLSWGLRRRSKLGLLTALVGVGIAGEALVAAAVRSKKAQPTPGAAAPTLRDVEAHPPFPGDLPEVDDVDESSKGSFPASDPPGWIRMRV